MILPWFGGSASVWTTCMLFFQATLLFGYIYSHSIVKALSPYRQSMLHIALLLISSSLLPLAEWALVSKDKKAFRDIQFVNVDEIDDPKAFTLWRDDYSSLLSVIK